jgi:tetratricopeptide (TPR) repeat protein
MGQSNRRWIIRDAAGHIEGPFTTEKVLYKISRGEFSGEESIAHYPEGKWIPISQDPEFYDKLLEVLAQNEGQETSEETRVLEFTRPQHTEAHKVEPPPPPPSASDPPPDLQTSVDQFATGDEVVQLSTATPLKPKRRRRKPRRPKDIELVDIRPEVWTQILRRARVPLILAAIAGLVVAYWSPSPPITEERIHLVAPQKNMKQQPADTLKPRTHKAVAEFVKDSFEGYVHAENDFVYVVERNTKNPEVMALLCMTYLNLWPYAHQDSADSKAIGTLVQMSAQVDPGGIHSGTCRAVDLVLRSRFQEAKSLVEAMLDARANEASPPILFYFLKGFLLEETGDHNSAEGYLKSAEQLWPQWLLPYAIHAEAYLRLEKYAEAGNIYRQILQANPNHTVARIELGLLEYKYFNHYDVGEQQLSQALDSDGAPRPTLSRGYFGLAEIALKHGDQSKALKFAQKSYSLNSSNKSAANLVVQLGGVEKLKTVKVKGQQLLFEGDQFAREGDCHSAQAHYKAAFEEDPKNANAAVKAAQCLWKMSFSTEAIDWLGRAIKSDPKLMEAYVTMADYQAQRFNFTEAMRTLNNARNVNPKSSEVFRGFAMVELKRGNPTGALSYGKQANQLYENDVETQILMAQASLALKDYKMAYNYASRATEIDVNHRQAQIVFADSLAGLQGIDVGLDYYLKLVNNYPLVTEYRLALGKMLAQDERYQQAEEIFRQITKLEEKPKEAYVELAKVLRNEGNMGEALDLLLKAAVLDPADAQPLFIAGTIYLDLKKPQEATVQFQRVLTINKLFPLVHYQLGRAALMLNDPHEAINQTNEEKRANPNLADAYLLAAESHSILQQYSDCAKEYQQAIKLRPQQASIYVRDAQCYRKAGNLDAASAMLNVAATKESGLADVWKEQGAIFEVKGDMLHAIESYNQYFALDPDAPDRRQIEDRISALQRGQTP